MSNNAELQVTIYTPGSLLANPLKMVREMFSDLLAGRELAWRLAVRDLSAQYRQTLLGFLWALILPLANTAVWMFLSASGVVVVADTGVPYPIYVFVGTMLWAVFMDAVNAPLQGTVAAKPMLAKINFPREAIIVSGIYQTLFNAAIKIFLVLLVTIWFGIWPGWGTLLIPIGVISLVLIGTTVGLMLTPVGILYQDVGRVLPLLMQFLMYATPVVFAMPKDGLAAFLFYVNPLTPIVQTTRAWVLIQPADMLMYYITVNLVGILVLVLLWNVYRLAMPILIERMSA